MPSPPPLRRRLTDRFGPGAGPWLDAVPARAAALAARWAVALDEAPPLGGSTSVLLRGRCHDRPVLLKLAVDRALSVAEGDALQGWSGGPVPGVLARDDAEGALLLEAIEPGDALGDRAEPPPVDAVAALLRGLRAPPLPAGLPPLAERAAWCFELVGRRRAGSASARAAVPAAALARGARLVHELATDRGAPVALVHGDLHPFNVLDGGPARRLVAIDPRPCAGDPGWDAVDLMLWRVGDEAAARRRIDALAAALGDPPERLAAWCAGLAALCAVGIAARADAGRREELATLLALAA